MDAGDWIVNAGTAIVVFVAVICIAMSYPMEKCETITKNSGHQYMKCKEMVGDDWNVDYTHLPDCEKCKRGK